MPQVTRTEQLGGVMVIFNKIIRFLFLSDLTVIPLTGGRHRACPVGVDNLLGVKLSKSLLETSGLCFAILNLVAKIWAAMASVLTYFALLGGLVVFAVGSKILLKKVKLL